MTDAQWLALAIVASSAGMVIAVLYLGRVLVRLIERVMEAHHSNLMLYQDNHAVLRELVKWREDQQRESA